MHKVLMALTSRRRAASDPVRLLLSHARRALLLLALLLSADASPKPSKQQQQQSQRVEIRVQDFSFSEGVSKRPVIEIEATDMKGSEVSDALLALAFDDTLKDDALEPHREEEPFSRQDALLLMLCALCGAQLVICAIGWCWQLLRRALRRGRGRDVKVLAALHTREDDDSAQLSDQDDSPETELLPHTRDEEPEASTSELFERQNALVRLCHIRFLVLAEKLKQELSGGGGGGGDDDDGSAVGEMAASLPVSQLDREDVRLADIVQVLAQIPLKEHGLSTERIENQIAAIQQDLSCETNADDVGGVWGQRLQELYASFQSIQHTIRTRKRAQSRQAGRAMSFDDGVGIRRASSNELSGTSVSSTSRTVRSSSSSSMVCSNSGSSMGSSGREPYASEVLGDLERVARTLPQGFTADMFSSLGQAIRQQSSPVALHSVAATPKRIRPAKRKPKQE